MAKIIEAKALITAEDGTGKAFAGIAAKLSALSATGQQVSKSTAQATSALGKRIAELGGQIEKIDGFRNLHKGLIEARARFNQAQGEVVRLGRAIEQAGKPTRELTRDYERAQRAVSSASQAFDAQRRAISASKSELSQAGIPISKLGAQQDELRRKLEHTTEAMRRQHSAAARSAVRREQFAGMASAAGLYASHKVRAGTRATLHTYREFDNERRFAKAVLGLSDEEMAPLVDQAIHGGATTKFNDIQYLHGQRDLAARGVKRDAILGMMPHAAALGMATDLSLPEAVKMIESGIFMFKKPTDTVDSAASSAKQTADVMTLAMKASGMTPEDISQIYKYGAPSAKMAGVSEQNLLAFGGVLKKAGIGGDEGGVAWRALMATLQNPTAGARTALLANGMDYARYQRVPDSMALDPFVRDVAAKYGVVLDDKAKGALGKVFANKGMISDPSKFAPAVMDVLSEYLGGDDAKSKKSIAGLARRYRDASMKGVDANAFFGDLFQNLKGNLQFANQLFGSKQGSRIATALNDPDTFAKVLEMLNNKSDGYAKKISDERMAGFDGAVSRFEGAIKNLETAVGRAWDSDGKGGPLTTVTDYLGQLVQKTAELPSGLVQGLSAALGVAGISAGAAGAWNIGKLLLTGGGLPASAVALNEAAAALNVAAARLGTAGAAGAAANGGAGAAAASKGSRVASLAKWGLYGAGAYLTYEAVKAIGDGNAELYKDVAPGEIHNEGNRRRHRGNQLFREQMMEDRASLGIPNGRYTGLGIIPGGAASFGFGPGGVPDGMRSGLEAVVKPDQITAKAEVSGNAKVEVILTPSPAFQGLINSAQTSAQMPIVGSGPGSTGRSMPEAAPTRSGGGGGGGGAM